MCLNPSFCGSHRRAKRLGGGVVSKPRCNKTLFGVSSAKLTKIHRVPQRSKPLREAPSSHYYRRFLFQLQAPNIPSNQQLIASEPRGALVSVPPASTLLSRFSCSAAIPSSRSFHSGAQFPGPVLPSQARRALAKHPLRSSPVSWCPELGGQFSQLTHTVCWGNLGLPPFIS